MWISVGAGYLSKEGCQHLQQRAGPCDSLGERGASYLVELRVAFMEAEDCHLLFISFFSFKM